MKKNVIFSYLLMLTILSSCGVYSLFPIYTKDTLVQKKEIMGKWVSDGDDQNYISFSRISYNINKKDSKPSGNQGIDNNISISFSGGEGDDVIDTGDYVIENGDTTIFKDTVKLQFEEIIEEKVDKLKGLTTDKKEDTFYFMRFFEQGEEVASFKAHLVKIGDDLFIDLLPSGGLDEENGASENYFPVHTFLKVKLTDTRLELKFFNQSKLKDLFKSNLVRIRHEIVDDRVLITAQPKEIQKFLEKYSKDESVFEEVDGYTKSTS